MLKRRPEYFVAFALSAVAAIGTALFTGICLDSGTPALSGSRKQDAAQIVYRASDLAGVKSEEKVTAEMRVFRR